MWWRGLIQTRQLLCQECRLNHSSSWRGNGGTIITDNMKKYNQHPLSFIVRQFCRESEAKSPPAKKLLFSDRHGKYHEWRKSPFFWNDQPGGNRKTPKTKETVLTLECRSTATTYEIKDRNDSVQGVFEFRVWRDILSDLKDASCSDGRKFLLVGCTENIQF